jgi:peroxiredoxin (alkyl hydroperoxide reductase subunit C)
VSDHVSRRKFMRGAGIGGIGLVIGGLIGYTAQSSVSEEAKPCVETKAPNFTLPSTYDRDISLVEYKGKYVVLVFYPEDFTPVCSSEIPRFNAEISKFEELDAQVLGISVQSVESHEKWIEELGGLEYPLLSDVNKEVSRKYGVLRPDGSVALRGTFIIDPDGVIQFLNVHNMEVGRSVEEILRVLEAIQTGELCPVEWSKTTST